MTQLEKARKGTLTAEMKAVADKEGLDPMQVLSGIAEGSIVIPVNINHTGVNPCGIGKGLRTKVNANIGTSSDYGDVNTELEKLRAAEEALSDTVMDLSTGGDINAIRRAIIASTALPLGTVPIYQAGIEAIDKWGSIVEMPVDHLFEVIREQAEDGVDFMTVHCGVTQKAVARLRESPRVTDVVSRGGAFSIGWMLHNDKENPLYEFFDRLLVIASKYDVTLSLGDGLRPGSLADASDRPQIEELLTIGELVERSRAAGVQVMVEGPGHMPLDQIASNVQLQKLVCKGAPFYVLGPLVTDIGAGYDHISAGIGGAIAAAYGADYLCYVTPSEHLSLPEPDDVREGVIATRLAAHAGDIVKGVKGARDWDLKMSIARKNLDWQEQIKLALDPVKATKSRAQHDTTGSGCSMCGQYCAMELVAKYLDTAPGRC
ncbi:MAG: phosphomethylpyrimidine synthase ThiC [Dehalococcoidia bacterium]|nr:MAG: phosphomethylpyrimidine synthase ThiC [Dehalococcoidia bacterium]